MVVTFMYELQKLTIHLLHSSRSKFEEEEATGFVHQSSNLRIGKKIPAAKVFVGAGKRTPGQHHQAHTHTGNLEVTNILNK